MSRFRLSLIAGFLAALAACDEAAAPTGSGADVAVRVYVDRDASGTFTAGDSAIAGVQVSATPGSGAGTTATATATTDAAGLADFQDLLPGSYTLAIVGGAPAGAVLTTAPAPTIGVSFQGTVTGRPEFRFSFFPGSLSGRIYRDDNANGSYDAGADTPGAGFLVTLRAVANGAAGAIVDTTRADANGQWTFARLAPGSYFVEFENPGTIDYGAAGGSRLVVVAPSGATPVPGVFTGSLVIPIDQARSRAVGANVEVEGVLTVAPGTFTFGTGNVNSELWVQDATGGIAVVQVPTSTTGLAVGQRVRVRGVRSDNAQQEQIGSTAAGATITAITGTAPVAPQAVTIDQAVARTGFEGELVTLSGFTVTSVGTGADYTVSGTVNGIAMQLRIESTTGILPTAFTVGTRYVVTGILTQFNAASQIKPRSPADISGPTTIATVRTTGTNGTAYTVSGSLTVQPGAIVSGTNGVNSEIWVQDATGGIAVFSVPTANTAGLALGDIVEVTGTRGAFANQLQLSTPGLVVTKVSAGTPLVPRDVTGAELVARTYEGQLVRLIGFTVTAVGTASAVGAFNVTGTAPTGQSVQFRVGGTGTGITTADFTVGSVYTITGVASINNTTIQLKPRTRADLVVGVPATPANVIINEFMANPATVNDDAGEYVELFNAGGTAQSLQGWIIADNGGANRRTIDVPLVIPAGGYVVLGINANTATNGGVTVDFQFSGATPAAIALAQGGDRIVLINASGATVDSVSYTSAHSASGVAWGVINPALDNADAAGGNWVAQTTVYNTTTVSDRGTPRARNDGAVSTIGTPAIRGALRAPGTSSSSTATRASGSATPRR